MGCLFLARLDFWCWVLFGGDFGGFTLCVSGVLISAVVICHTRFWCRWLLCVGGLSFPVICQLIVIVVGLVGCGGFVWVLDYVELGVFVWFLDVVCCRWCNTV